MQRQWLTTTQSLSNDPYPLLFWLSLRPYGTQYPQVSYPGSPPQLRVRPPCCAQGANREGLDAAGQPSATALTGSFISAV